MKTTIVYDLYTGEEIVFVNDLNQIENLVSAVIANDNKSFQIHDKKIRQEYTNLIEYSQNESRKMASIGDFAIYL
jgi:hypothetical protein